MSALQVILGLLVAVAVLALAARKLHVPYPIVLVVGGLTIALVPGLPPVTLAPDVVFLVFLPPLVYSAGWLTSLRDFKANLRPIGLLSIGLVLATTGCIAVLAHALVPGLPWAAAFALGAIVSPTDTVAPQAIDLSGVLAVAAAGIYASRRNHETFSAATRLQAIAVWEVCMFVMNGLVFVLIGLQLPLVREGLAGQPVVQLLGYGLAISLAVILVRLLWVFPATYLPRLLSPRVRAKDPYPDWREVVVVAWTGMRGVVSLAAALSLPLTTAGGRPFPGRDLIVLITFCVILVTLVGQGLTLPPLLRWLRLGGGDAFADEETAARTRAIDAALARLEELGQGEGATEDGMRYLRAYYGKRRRTVETQAGQVDHEHGPEDGLRHAHESGRDHVDDHRDRPAAMTRLHLELLGAERAAIVRLRDIGEIGDEVLLKVQRDLDLEEVRLGAR